MAFKSEGLREATAQILDSAESVLTEITEAPPKVLCSRKFLNAKRKMEKLCKFVQWCKKACVWMMYVGVQG